MRLKNGEFQFGLWDFVKTRGVSMIGKLKINEVKKNNCKIELLELSGYWMRVLQVTERSSGSFPRVGEDDL